jgi:ComF family protein
VLANALSILGREALHFVLPSWCVACRRPLPWQDRTASCCGPCWSALPRIESAKCRSCATPLPGDGLCLACQLDPLPVDWCDAWGHYRGTLEAVLHAFKFARHDFLENDLAALLDETLLDRDFDALVPVPMSRAKERRRGYNQAELLARALGARLGVATELLLTKRGERRTQSLLPRNERKANVRDAFTASLRVRGRKILIVDDICTTGETLRACAASLRGQGASRVCAIALAKA